MERGTRLSRHGSNLSTTRTPSNTNHYFIGHLFQTYFENILTCFECSITNVASERLNFKIRGIKASARGIRNFKNYRVSILFFYGKPELSP